eukprot:12670814-Alexandrium_andersonii.AAC.1
MALLLPSGQAPQQLSARAPLVDAPAQRLLSITTHVPLHPRHELASTAPRPEGPLCLCLLYTSPSPRD